jgi:RimJ/RimL family protein N-acetyltransferase
MRGGVADGRIQIVPLIGAQMYETVGAARRPWVVAVADHECGDAETVAITLRAFADSDLDALFIWESDPRAVEMAAFTRAEPSDRSAFDAHYERVRSNPSNTLLAIDDDGEFVGTISSFTIGGDREVSYWIAPARWGQGLASRALSAFLAIEPTRPLYGRVASHNAASAKVLARAGFAEVGSETAFARGVGGEVLERSYRLDRLAGTAQPARSSRSALTALMAWTKGSSIRWVSASSSQNGRIDG